MDEVTDAEIDRLEGAQQSSQPGAALDALYYQRESALNQAIRSVNDAVLPSDELVRRADIFHRYLAKGEVPPDPCT